MYSIEKAQNFISELAQERGVPVPPVPLHGIDELQNTDARTIEDILTGRFERALQTAAPVS